jgi:hypothetical protein
MPIFLTRETVLAAAGIVLAPLVLGAVLLPFLLIAMIGAVDDIRRALQAKLRWTDARTQRGAPLRNRRKV